MFDGFDYWNDALNNMRESNRKRAQKLIDKYGLPIDRNSLEGGDEYD